MGKKLISLIGIGAGVALVRKEMKKNPNGPVAKTVNSVANNAQVQKATHATKEKAGNVLKKQGEKVTDKVADAVKQRLFGIDPKPAGDDAVYVDIEVEEVKPTGKTGSATSTH